MNMESKLGDVDYLPTSDYQYEFWRYCQTIMRIFLLVIATMSSFIQAKELVVYAEISPPYIFLENNQVKGIYKDILDNAFKDEKYKYVLKIANTRSLLRMMKNNDLISFIGIAKIHPLFEQFARSNSLGKTYIHPITKNSLRLPTPYEKSFANLNVGVVSAIGMESLVPDSNLVTYKYAKQGVLKLLNSELDVILEDPLIVACSAGRLANDNIKQVPISIHHPEIAVLDLYFAISVLHEGYEKIISRINKSILKVNADNRRADYFKPCNAENNHVVIENASE